VTRDPRELAGAWATYQHHDFPPPAPDLAHYIEAYWVVSWRYTEPYRQLVVPYPNVHLTFQAGHGTVRGVSSRHQVRVLEGCNGVFGVAFRPGCFRPFLGSTVAAITDRSIEARAVFAGEPAHPVDAGAVDRFLRAHLPARDATALDVADMVARIAADPGVLRVDALATELGTSVRRLQRLFAEYVGIGPKWVIRRYRLREVTERMASGARVDWASLAAELGYADQPHFVRDFTDVFGESPTRYAARY
jgi:AraC-like DNA-binding protein